MNETSPMKPLGPKDFATDQDVRWCPGCGDYAILKGVQKTLADIGARPENTVFISGIGCAARFPYYMKTYGFHTIHGRAAAVATGVKLANPDLDLWIVGGDGDSLSIGANHLFHLLRRNVDVQYLLFNNEIYGLTKGQYSPTSRAGLRTPSSPAGAMEQPAHAIPFALGAGARFVARGGDVRIKELSETLKRAHAHKGASFVEILQNCIVYNDGAFGHIMDKDKADDAQIHLENGQPMRFGREAKKGLRLKPGKLQLEAVTIGENGVTEADILIHDETDRVMAGMLAAMEGPDLPVAMGVIYCAPTAAFDQQIADVMGRRNPSIKKLQNLIEAGHTWTVG
ncbi:2-oxoacid:ferredoxin oxidoreductase subunit beta [Aestuariispira insulae]|uniref:2-oxoglutarate ferredoxin oxidoreductase subunit beta n=1 Tax=Aestuariispira insulae TaxID=1461337 RepID=A0A3D9HEU6_9PROT|nr:2-oxoacid:ferredoxin oxidoreductase subunit beta [Aestuariispira insulae]RED48012.1 2-oxoglutarate ferredoxin oxidoreductase subunit beta [Aestuariispira insulae]